jgi:hypothetical protein
MDIRSFLYLMLFKVQQAAEKGPPASLRSIA